MLKYSEKPRRFTSSTQAILVGVPVLYKLPVFHTFGSVWDPTSPAGRGSGGARFFLGQKAAAPGQGLARGGRVRRQRWRRTRTHFQLLFVYTEVFDHQSPEDSWWLCQEAEGQTATGPWGAKGQSPLRHSLCQLGLTPKPSISWPSWSKYSSGLNHSGCKPGQAVGCKQRFSFPPQQGPHGWRHKIQLGPLGSLVETDAGNDNNPNLPEYSD